VLFAVAVDLHVLDWMKREAVDRLNGLWIVRG
jgi:hypothetical protein